MRDRQGWQALAVIVLAVVLIALAWWLFQPLEEATDQDGVSPEVTEEKTGETTQERTAELTTKSTENTLPNTGG